LIIDKQKIYSRTNSLLSGTAMDRWRSYLNDDEEAYASMKKFADNGGELESVDFFLSACNGVIKPEWSASKKVYEDPCRFSLQELRQLAHNIESIAHQIRDVNGNPPDEPSPANYILSKYGSSPRSDDVNRVFFANRFDTLPAMLICFGQCLEEWWNSKYHPRDRQEISREYLKAHFYVYARNLARLTYDEVAVLLESARIALHHGNTGDVDQRGTDPQSLKSIVSRFRRKEPERYAAMEQSVNAYLSLQRLQTVAVSYVAAAGYTGQPPISKAIREVYNPLRPKRHVDKQKVNKKPPPQKF
jgi:hypothetical protein